MAISMDWMQDSGENDSHHWMNYFVRDLFDHPSLKKKFFEEKQDEHKENLFECVKDELLRSELQEWDLSHVQVGEIDREFPKIKRTAI